jgi:hypothetical protein
MPIVDAQQTRHVTNDFKGRIVCGLCSFSYAETEGARYIFPGATLNSDPTLFKSATKKRNHLRPTLFKFIARMFSKRAVSVSLARRAQWAAVKAVALQSNDARLIEVVRDAEEQARETIADVYGRAALLFPTDKHLDELCGVALRLIPATSEYRAYPEVRQAFAAAFVAT